MGTGAKIREIRVIRGQWFISGLCLLRLLWPIWTWSPQKAQESQNMAEPRQDPDISKEANRGLHR